MAETALIKSNSGGEGMIMWRKREMWQKNEIWQKGEI